MSNFPIDAAQTVALFMESIFYGIFLVTFGLCMNVLLVQKQPGASLKYNMIVVALLMFIFATLDVAFGLRHNLDAFVYYNGPGGAKEELLDISYWVNVMKSVDYVAQTFVGDGMLLYRCYIVWGKQKLVIALPAILWLCGIAFGAVAFSIERSLHDSILLSNERLRSFIAVFMSCTLTFNVITTSLIVYKIWSITHEISSILRQSNSLVSSRGSYLTHAIRITIESGLMYTFTVITFFCLYMASNNALYGVSDAVVPMIGIVFNLIIIRVHRRATTEFTLQTLKTQIFGAEKEYLGQPAPSLVVYPNPLNDLYQDYSGETRGHHHSASNSMTDSDLVEVRPVDRVSENV